MVEIPAEDSDKSDKSDSDSETESQPTEFSVVMDTVVCWENAIPKELLSIKPAGSGSFGKVFYCIPRDALEDYPNIAKQPTKKLPGSLKAQICAVKVHSATTMVEQAWAEAEILKYIQQADEFPGRHLSRLLAANIPATGLSTITMEAVMGPTLDHFWNSYMGRFDSQWMPKEFVWHVFLQLGAAIRFIHSMNVSHNDLHDGNVMLNMARQDFPGLPNVVLIDFGQANHFETEARNPFRTKPAVPAEKIELLIEDDNAAFFQILYALSMGIVDREDSWDWHTFTALLEDSAYGFGSRGQSDAQKCVLDKMTTRYEAPAIAERAKISQKAKENIARHLSVVTVVRSLGLSDDEIRSAVVAELDKA
ncbi:kinase-like protein [Lophium mytilinum]|uniref:Kinase-like protein n=1 Tax=Lophium mytilinum TaxID=390894 RepID=A0A6A6QFR0_9PEZI|nr:kinase-like protein [Lophium mytilinum]